MATVLSAVAAVLAVLGHVRIVVATSVIEHGPVLPVLMLAHLIHVSCILGIWLVIASVAISIRIAALRTLSLMHLLGLRGLRLMLLAEKCRIRRIVATVLHILRCEACLRATRGILTLGFRSGGPEGTPRTLLNFLILRISIVILIRQVALGILVIESRIVGRR